jgi:CDP-diglyceride synthetase
MSKWLKQFLFGIWGLLLILMITPILEKWLEENIFSDPSGMATPVFPNAVATTFFNNLLALGQQRRFKFALVFLTGIVIGVSVEWLNRKSDEKKAFELRSLGTKFRSLSDNIKIRTVSSGWPDNVRDLKPAIQSVFISAKKFDLWAPNEHVYR